ncbi:hypothetical protein [Methanolobus sp.]|uniref:hypothetical protein n=1 Tax=Methanolobus sp. TaxID=1874737 RepID=UPI00272EF8E9|nr:hypothetical protein [Methanolobus sp.]
MDEIIEDLASVNAEIKELDERIARAINDNVVYDLMREKRLLLERKELCEIKLKLIKPVLASPGSKKPIVIVDDIIE